MDTLSRESSTNWSTNSLIHSQIPQIPLKRSTNTGQKNSHNMGQPVGSSQMLSKVTRFTIAVTKFALIASRFFSLHLGWKTRNRSLKTRLQSLLFWSCQEVLSDFEMRFAVSVHCKIFVTFLKSPSRVRVPEATYESR